MNPQPNPMTDTQTEGEFYPGQHVGIYVFGVVIFILAFFLLADFLGGMLR